VRRVRQLAWLKENEFELAVAAIPVVTTVIAVYLVLSLPSNFEQYMTSACNGLRDANGSISSADRSGVEEGWSTMGALDPAGEQRDADQTAVQRGWAAYGALHRALNRWDESSGSVAPEDQPLIDRALETCEPYDYPWYSPYQVIASK
jgi:hypothetical protein